MTKKISEILLLTVLIFCMNFYLSSCSRNSVSEFEMAQNELLSLLERSAGNPESSFSIVNQIATNYLSANDYNGATLFLTNWIATNKEDPYSSYWLLMTAYAYLSMSADPIAEYYFSRILSEYPDLLVRGNSVHYICLTNLIQISKTPHNRIKYFNELINRFSDKVSTTELYLRLALEYEKENEWEQAMRSYSLFLEQPDAAQIQIVGEPDAYRNARQLFDFNNSTKDWTFESLDALENAVKTAIADYDWRSLDKCRSKVNFFSISWRQDEMDTNARSDFSMRSFMRGNRISVAQKIEESATPNEVYLRTWGWSQYVSVWYFCFRRVNFPIDPDIHGNWEWAGIYMGERL